MSRRFAATKRGRMYAVRGSIRANQAGADVRCHQACAANENRAAVRGSIRESARMYTRIFT